MNTSNSSNHLSLIHPNTVEDMISEDYNSGEDTLEALREFEREKYYNCNDAFQKSLTSLENIDKELDKIKDFIMKDLSSCLMGSNIHPHEPQGHPILEKDYMNFMKEITDGKPFYARKFYEFKDKIGDGEMKYIEDVNKREMLTNAWKAITFTNNWDFVSEFNDSFMWSKDPKIDEISEEMDKFGYNGHSGASFGYTMCMMKYLVKYGEDKFKQLFDKNLFEDNNVIKFIDYSGGF